MNEVYIRLVLLTVILLVAIYVFGCLLSRKVKKIEPKKAILYASSVAMIGVLGEIFVNTLYADLFPTSLWRYNYLPIYEGSTSQYAPFLWGSFGFYLYMVHQKYQKWTPENIRRMAIIFGLEAMVLEAIVDLISKPILGDYIFYYYPEGLWHISAFQNFPFYFLCGGLIIQTLHWFSASPRFFTILSTWVVIVTVFFRAS